MLHRLYIAIGILVFAAAHHGQAQILIGNAFSGTNTATPTTTLNDAGLGASASNVNLGPGFKSSMSLGLFGSSLTNTINAGNDGTLTISGTGTTVGLGFTDEKVFTGTSLAANTTYQLTLTSLTSLTTGLLGTLSLQIVQGGTTVASSSVLSLLQSGTSATVTFTTPAGLNTSQPIDLTLSGSSLLSLGSTTLTFTGLSIQAVPEPSDVALMGAGLVALLGLRFVRVPRAQKARR